MRALGFYVEGHRVAAFVAVLVRDLAEELLDEQT